MSFRTSIRPRLLREQGGPARAARSPPPLRSGGHGTRGGLPSGSPPGRRARAAAARRAPGWSPPASAARGPPARPGRRRASPRGGDTVRRRSARRSWRPSDLAIIFPSCPRATPASASDAVTRTIAYTSPEGKRYALGAKTATLVVRPRGWHLVEKHLTVDGQPISASLFDFGLTFFHTATKLAASGSGPYFYLPKLESHLEARLWNDVFVFAQDALGIPRGTIRATVLIETILAAFETDEILWELRDHSAGLNCGRWDYIFSYIKKLRRRPECVLPDRARVTMEQPFLRAYADLVVHTCHRRGIHALGGMAAQIPIKRDAALNAQALEKVRQDKLREVRQVHDGTWVAHPGLVPIARQVLDAHTSELNQIGRRREDVRVSARDLLATPAGDITAEGLHTNLSIALQYLAGWLGGMGCVPINYLMEDAATAEISRAQVWQWLHHGARMQDGRPITATMVQQIIAELVQALPERVGPGGPGYDKFSMAGRILADLATGADFAEFLTTVAYEYLD